MLTESHLLYITTESCEQITTTFNFVHRPVSSLTCCHVCSILFISRHICNNTWVVWPSQGHRLIQPEFVTTWSVNWMHKLHHIWCGWLNPTPSSLLEQCVVLWGVGRFITVCVFHYPPMLTVWGNNFFLQSITGTMFNHLKISMTSTCRWEVGWGGSRVILLLTLLVEKRSRCKNAYSALLNM